MSKMTVTRLGPDTAPDFEIADRDDEHVITLDWHQAVELRTALDRAMHLERGRVISCASAEVRETRWYVDIVLHDADDNQIETIRASADAYFTDQSGIWVGTPAEYTTED